MADNVVANSGSGGATFAADDIGGVHFPRTKFVIGADGSNDGDVSSANPMPVTGTVAITNAALTELAAAINSSIVDVNVTNTVTVASHAVTNAGTFAVQAAQSGAWNITNVSGTVSLPTGASTLAEQQTQTTALQKIDDPVLVDDAAFTPATSSVMMAGFQADESSTDSVNEGDAGAARMTLDRKQIVTAQAHTAGGALPYKSLDLDETEEEVKATPGQVYGFIATNRRTSPLFFKFYNDTAANVSVGTTVPVMTIEIPANATDHTAMVTNFPVGVQFDAAICIAATTGFADNDTGAPGANELIVNVFYK